jgi:RNA polymerase sigma-70 factor (ECF subfamily)
MSSCRATSPQPARLPGSERDEAGRLDDLTLQTADEALVALLGKLSDYRGASRVTTWAYKFAVLEASVRLRRRAWQEREVVLEPSERGCTLDST